ncbi:hypothetical protein ElP_19160 [Tautonia plasticadhaerens]|uniref:Uncharacterized protein n=1 Tax=Tautonia plasticadhaerens TaxID=2527974 RepID=A0A518GZM0_9BACT|nr:hypothetical protein ElP_19160 [Tautonia plasticadhaerens]
MCRRRPDRPGRRAQLAANLLLALAAWLCWRLG